MPFIRNTLKTHAQAEISQSALNAKKAGEKTTPASLHRNNQEWDRPLVCPTLISSLTPSSGLRGGLLLRGDRPGVHRGRPRRVSGPARDEEDLHLTAVYRYAAGAHGDAVDVDLDVEAAVRQAVARVLGALHVQAGRPLHIGAITVDHEPGGRVGLQRGNHAVLQDLLASVVYAGVVTLEGRTLADLAGRGRRRRRQRLLHGDAGRAAGRTTAGLGSRRDPDVDCRAWSGAGRIEHSGQAAAADGSRCHPPLVSDRAEVASTVYAGCREVDLLARLGRVRDGGHIEVRAEAYGDRRACLDTDRLGIGSGAAASVADFDRYCVIARIETGCVELGVWALADDAPAGALP